MASDLSLQWNRPRFRLGAVVLWLGMMLAALGSFVPRQVSAAVLEPIEQVAGTIWDVSAKRILFLDTSGDRQQLKIRYRASGEELTISSADGRDHIYGYLTLGGAIFVVDHVLDARVYEWSNGELRLVGYPNSAFSLTVSSGAKRYAIWNGGFADLFERLFILRDLQEGTNTVVSSGGVVNWFNDVDKEGGVVFGSYGAEYNIFRYRSGAITKLTDDRILWNTYPQTDGINVVYRKHDRCCRGQQYQIVMYTDGLGETVLRPAGPSEPSSGRDYQLRGGWVAFTKPDDRGQMQVWVHSPHGTDIWISRVAPVSHIDAMAPNGEVAFIAAGRRYLGAPRMASIDIGSADGKSFWQGGQWYVHSGGTLYKVVR